MAQPLNVTIHLTGLIAYALRPGHIEAIMPAEGAPCPPAHAHGADAGHGGHDPGGGEAAGLHLAALVLPLTAADKGSSAPDAVLNHGPEELGLWYLQNTVVEVWRDGSAPESSLKYARGRDLPHPPADDTADDLFWLPDIQRAIGMPGAGFRPGCFPPSPDASLVKSVVRLMEGTAAALWSDERHKNDLWEFRNPVRGSKVPGREYRQAFADGIRWSFDCREFVEIRLSDPTGETVRSVYVPFDNPDVPSVTGAITNKPTIVEGRSVLEAETPAAHFHALYSLMAPSPGRLARRLLVPADARTSTTTNRCPGGSGG